MDHRSYDYVIVGAGSAGCVLAARLSENPDLRVALIEAGGPDTAQEIHIPAAFPQLFKTQYDWDLSTDAEPQLDGRRTYLPRGRMLGGSSSMNAMIYIRGNRADYDGWAAEGATGWSYDDLLPYFIKAEGNERGEDQFHGALGPLQVRDGRSMHTLADCFVEAAVQAGYRHTDDFNGPVQDGVGRYQFTQKNGMRCSAAVAYLHPAMSRPNLTVITDATASKIVLDGLRATGVEILRNGAAETLHADREVVLSAGAYGSPQLMLLSGIGPAAGLAPLGIAPVHELPVGENLQDHPAVFLTWFTDTPSLFGAATADNAALLTQEGRGPLTSNVAEAGGFIRTRPGLDAPDVQFHSGPAMFFEEGLGEIFDHAFTVGPCVVKPTSRGRVSLRSARPDAKARIQHNYLATKEDRESMMEGVRAAMRIAGQPALAAVSRAPHLTPASDSDADIWTFVQRRCHTLYHPTSSCSIGKVVDSELRVLGMEGLRVVDASVMPSVPRGNTNAPTIAIAEKAADLISGAAGARREMAQAAE